MQGEVNNFVPHRPITLCAKFDGILLATFTDTVKTLLTFYLLTYLLTYFLWTRCRIYNCCYVAHCICSKLFNKLNDILLPRG